MAEWRINMTALGREGARYTGLNRRYLTNVAALLVSDGMMLALCLMLSGVVRFFLVESHIPPSRGFLLIPVWWAGAILFRLVPGWGLGAVEELRRMQTLLLVVFGMAAIAMFMTKSADVTSRLKYLIVYLLAVPLVPLGRTFIKHFMIRWNSWGIPVAMYGKGRDLNELIALLHDEKGLGYLPTQYFGPQGILDAEHQNAVVRGGDLLDSSPVCPVAVVDGRMISPQELGQLIDGPLSKYSRIIIVPDLYEIPTLWVRACDLLGLLGLEVNHNLINPLVRRTKEIVEYALVLLTLPLWAPLVGVLALAVWLEDRHAPVYAQERIGEGDRVFKTFKLRSMIPDADAWLEQKLAADPEFARKWSVDFKMRHDPRITRVGRFLRRTSLDELPQLWNVLRGEMALVGPRPLPLYHLQKLPQRVRELREKVRPGVTGLWQVSGRSKTGTAGMERWDSYYVRNWSPWLDVVILVRTIRAVCHRDGAY